MYGKFHLIHKKLELESKKRINLNKLPKKVNITVVKTTTTLTPPIHFLLYNI